MNINKIYNIDCLDGMKLMDDNSVDTVITDPPYGLNFMGKKWDYDIPSIEIWKECLRVLKPGGFLLSFAGTRTQHRMACNIEDAGFEIRDMICWLYGSGFPKSLDISKSIDKVKDVTREIIGKGISGKKESHSIMNMAYKEGSKSLMGGEYDITIPATPEAQLWDGWGTALKPAMEPITVAMKPFKGTFVDNALEWGVAGLNIDGGRIGEPVDTRRPVGKSLIGTFQLNSKISGQTDKGRYPSNVILDETATQLLDQQAPKTGQLASTTGNEPSVTKLNQIYGDYRGYANANKPRDKLGGVSRFFYTAKASKSERNKGCKDLEDRLGGSLDGENDKRKGKDIPQLKLTKNYHPTVKPVSLIEYLCKLTRPPTGGVVLDPFIGSGTTAIACKYTNRGYIGFEKDPDYYKIAKARIKSTVTIDKWL